MIRIYTDGSIQEKNPGGVACWGWIAFEDVPGRTNMSSEVARGYGIACEGEGATSNVAEYHAVLEALKAMAVKRPNTKVVVMSDSQLVVYQLTGKYGVSANHLRKLRDATLALGGSFEAVEFVWIPREQNTEADALSRKAYEERRLR
jgi:ribonuclease HI